MSIYTDLVKIGVPADESMTIEAEYKGVNDDNFVNDLNIISLALVSNALPPIVPAGEPFKTMYHMLSIAPNVKEGLDAGLSIFNNPALKLAMDTAITWGAFKIVQDQNAAQSPAINQKVPTAQAARVVSSSRLMSSPDQQLKNQIHVTVANRGLAIEKNQAAARVLIDWMMTNGKLIKSPQGETYFLSNTKGLYKLTSDRFLALLSQLLELSPASDVFNSLLSNVRAAAVNVPTETPVFKLSHYDIENNILRVSDFSGGVYVLDGESITRERNGENVLFEDSPLWEPYSIELGEPGLIDRLTSTIPNWKQPFFAEIFKNWLFSLFFTELCPTRPIMLIVGEKGSGKSMLLRVVLRLIFGRWAEVAGAPDQPDAMTAAAANNHLLIIDNLDGLFPWMRDKLARLSTGGVDTCRKLYTTNDELIIFYRCWLAFTSRTPDTFRRDDIMDRTLLLTVGRISDTARIREGKYLNDMLKIRGQFWGELMSVLNSIVAEIKVNPPLENSPLRLADWEAFARSVSGAVGNPSTWLQSVDYIKKSQSEFLALDNPIVEALEVWINRTGNDGRAILARDLYAELQEILYPYPLKVEPDWPRSAAAFGRRVNDVAEFLKAQYGMVKLEKGRGTYYQFSK